MESPNSPPLPLLAIRAHSAWPRGDRTRPTSARPTKPWRRPRNARDLAPGARAPLSTCRASCGSATACRFGVLEATLARMASFQEAPVWRVEPDLARAIPLRCRRRRRVPSRSASSRHRQRRQPRASPLSRERALRRTRQRLAYRRPLHHVRKTDLAGRSWHNRDLPPSSPDVRFQAMP